MVVISLIEIENDSFYDGNGSSWYCMKKKVRFDKNIKEDVL